MSVRTLAANCQMMIDAKDTLRPGVHSLHARVVWLAFIVLGLATLTVMVALYGGLSFTRAYTFHGLLFEPPLSAPDFRLIDQNEQPIRLSDYRGKLVLLVFGYTHCPDACPATLSTLNRALEELGDSRDQVQVLLVSVDPEEDTPSVLKEYLGHFNPTFVGLTGRPEEIAAVTSAYGVFVEKEEASAEGSHLVGHTALTYVLDRQGRRVLAFPLGMEQQEIAADLKFLLRR